MGIYALVMLSSRQLEKAPGWELPALNWLFWTDYQAERLCWMCIALARTMHKYSLFFLPSGRLLSFLRQLVDKDGCALSHNGERAQIHRFFDRMATGSHHS